MRAFIAAAALGASLVSTTAFTQPLSPSAASIPDLSGIWVHPYFPGLEPPLSGPGPVLNKSRRPDGGSNPRRLVGDYTNPI